MPRKESATTYNGSCHCGKIRYQVEGTLGEVCECNCSHCGRKGYLLWFPPRAALKLLTAESELAVYAFNKLLETRPCSVNYFWTERQCPRG